MVSKRKFYKNVLTVEVLSEEPISGHLSLKDIEYMITDGDCSGDIKWKPQVVLNGKKCADALSGQGSEPGFFRLDDEGNDTDEDEYGYGV